MIRDTLTELRPEVAADIYDRGVILTGGGARLTVSRNTSETLSTCRSLFLKSLYATVNGLLKCSTIRSFWTEFPETRSACCRMPRSARSLIIRLILSP